MCPGSNQPRHGRLEMVRSTILDLVELKNAILGCIPKLVQTKEWKFEPGDGPIEFHDLICGPTPGKKLEEGIGSKSCFIGY